MTKSPTELNEARETIERLVILPPATEAQLDNADRLAAKLHCLSRLIDRLRGECGSRKTGPWTKGLGDLGFADPLEGHLVFVERNRADERASPRQAEALLAELLVFLHESEAPGLPVNEIIHLFERRMKPRLSGTDYDTHQSGAVRFQVNAAFAASRLREMGLLLNTSRERHRTWRLSLVGIVAARLLKEATTSGSEIPIHGPSSLLRFLHGQLNGLRDGLPPLLMRVAEEAFLGQGIPQAQQDGIGNVIERLGLATGRPQFGRPAPTPALLGQIIRSLAGDPVAVEIAQRWAGLEVD